MDATHPAYCRPAAFQAFTAAIPAAGTPQGLFRAAWAIAQHERPQADLAAGETVIENLIGAIRRRIRSNSDEARLAHLHAKGRLKVGEAFVHESYICSRFIGRVEAETEIGGQRAIIPSIEGSAIATGRNEIWIDDEDVFAHGFQVV